MIGNGRAYQEKPAYLLTKLLRRRLLSFFRCWDRKGYDVCYVRINNKHYKKIIFRNEAFANCGHHDLKAFEPSLHFPTVVG